ncbi:DinB family protein [Nocardioides pyridinolyticus]
MSEIRGEWFRNVYARDVVVRGGWFENVDIDAELRNVVVNGVDIHPLLEAELNRRDPERHLIHPQDADGFRAGWAMTERRWAATVERARALPAELLHERVEEEWSFIESLRHLVMATDAWVLRVIGGDPRPFSPLGLPHDEMGDIPGVPNDRTLRPTLDEVLAVRAERMAVVRRVIGALSDADLDQMTEPVTEPGYPESRSYRVGTVLEKILVEEYLHRGYAERDLAVLEARL